MLFWFGILTYLSLIFSLAFLIAAIMNSTEASDFDGRVKINSYLTTFFVFLVIFVVLSSLNVLLNIIKWARLSDKLYNKIRNARVSEGNLSETGRMERTITPGFRNSETMLNEIVTGSPGSEFNGENPHQF